MKYAPMIFAADADRAAGRARFGKRPLPILNMPMYADPNLPKVGDRVKVIIEPHMPDQDEGVVRQVICGALGIEFDAMPGMVHHWYIASEVVVVSAAPMPMEATAGDKSAARTAWKARFENRRLPTEQRQAKAVEVRAAADDTTEILLMDEIGFWGITARDFIEKLSGVTTGKIVVRINSPGGDVFDGLAIYNALRSHAAEVTIVVEGLAASAASFIALAGDNVRIHDSAMMMIHRAWGLAIGNEADMTDMAKTLQKIDGQLAGIYAKKTGKGAGEMLALMSGEADGTWFTAAEAVDLGLADQVIDDPREDGADAEARAMMVRVSAMRRRLALAEQD